MEKYLNISPVYFTWRFWGGEVSFANFPFLMSGKTYDESIVSRAIIKQTLEVYTQKQLLSCSKFEIKVHSPRQEIPAEDLMSYIQKITSEVTSQLILLRKTAPTNT